MEKLKKNQGITLIALVITIIVLLILAGISIQGLTGSGIFEKAKQSIEKSKYAGALEKVRLAVTASYNETGNINNEYLYENLDNIDGKEELKENEEKDAYLVKVDGYLFVVSKTSGEIRGKDIEIADGEVDSSRDQITINAMEYNTLKNIVAELSNKLSEIYTNNLSTQSSYEYSKSENIVGKWIDGKDLYQKTYQITTPNTTSTTSVVASIDDLNYDTCFIVGGYVTNGVNCSEINSKMLYTAITTDKNTDKPSKIVVEVLNSSFQNKTAYITIQYTKK